MPIKKLPVQQEKLPVAMATVRGGSSKSSVKERNICLGNSTETMEVTCSYEEWYGTQTEIEKYYKRCHKTNTKYWKPADRVLEKIIT